MLEARRHARAALPARARLLPPRRLDLPVADARLPRVDRDRRAPRRARDPAPRLVEPRRAAARRVRLVVRRPARVGTRAGPARQRRQPERAAPAAQRRDGVRGARGRRAHDGGDQHHDLPRPPPAPLADPRLPARARAEAVLLLQPLRVRQDRRAAGLAGQPRRRLDRRLRRLGRALARHARRLRPARLLPARLRLRLARARARTRRTRRSAAQRRGDRGAVRRGRRAGRVPRAVRGDPVLRPRADARRARRAARRSTGAP